MPAPSAISVVSRVILSSFLAAAITALVGWMINEIRKDDERQRQRRIRERDENDPGRKGREDA